MNRITEDTIIAREAKAKLIRYIIAMVYDSRIIGDCRAHLAEMELDPTYVPYGLTIEHMVSTGGEKSIISS